MILLLFLFFVFLYLLLIMPRLRKPELSALLKHHYAHRGLHNLRQGIPENSMAAFARAVIHGYGIELDVQLSKDGQAVVFHDATLNRMCGVDKRVDALTLAELKELSLAGTREKIPAFQEFLDLINGQVPLVVEIKMDKKDDRIPEEVNRLLKDYKGVYCIESFHPSALIWYKKHRPDVVRGQLSTNMKKDMAHPSFVHILLGYLVSNIAAKPDFIAYNWKYRKNISFQLCTKLLGALPVAWTIRSQEELDLSRNDFRLFIFENFNPR